MRSCRASLEQQRRAFGELHFPIAERRLALRFVPPPPLRTLRGAAALPGMKTSFCLV